MLSQRLAQIYNEYACASILYLNNQQLNDNDMAEVVNFVKERPKIVYLYLQKNHLTDACIKHLSKLTQLNTLYLSNNAFTDLSLNTILNNLHNLKFFGMSRNKVTLEHGFNFYDHEKLTMLDLSENPLRLTQIDNELKYHWPKNLSILYLTESDLSLVSSLLHCHNLNKLYFVNAKLNDELIQCVFAHKNLKQLTLDHCKLDPDSFSHLHEQQQLTYLNVTGTILGNKGVSYLSRLSKLTHLFVANTGISDEGVCSIALLPQLTVCDLSNNQIGDNGILVLSQHNKLKYLSANNNLFGCVGVRALAQANQLEVLAIEKNNLQSESMIAFIDNTSLIELNVANNQIGNEGVQYLAANPHLIKLNVSNNKISDEGITVFYNHPSLSSLTALGNPLTDESAIILHGNLKLTNLSISTQHFHEETKQHLKVEDSIARVNAPHIFGYRTTVPSLFALSMFVCKKNKINVEKVLGGRKSFIN